MTWILYASIAALALAAADIFLKVAAGRISNSLGLLLYGGCTFSMGLGWVLWQRIHGVTQHGQTGGVLAAIGVGITFCIVTAALYATYGAAAPISLAFPFIRFSALLLASLAGFLLWHEPLTLRYVIGIVLACSGVYLIITR